MDTSQAGDLSLGDNLPTLIRQFLAVPMAESNIRGDHSAIPLRRVIEHEGALVYTELESRHHVRLWADKQQCLLIHLIEVLHEFDIFAQAENSMVDLRLIAMDPFYKFRTEYMSESGGRAIVAGNLCGNIRSGLQTKLAEWLLELQKAAGYSMGVLYTSCLSMSDVAMEIAVNVTLQHVKCTTIEENKAQAYDRLETFLQAKKNEAKLNVMHAYEEQKRADIASVGLLLRMSRVDSKNSTAVADMVRLILGEHSLLLMALRNVPLILKERMHVMGLRDPFDDVIEVLDVAFSTATWLFGIWIQNMAPRVVPLMLFCLSTLANSTISAHFLDTDCIWRRGDADCEVLDYKLSTYLGNGKTFQIQEKYVDHILEGPVCLQFAILYRTFAMLCNLNAHGNLMICTVSQRIFRTAINLSQAGSHAAAVLVTGKRRALLRGELMREARLEIVTTGGIFASTLHNASSAFRFYSSAQLWAILNEGCRTKILLDVCQTLPNLSLSAARTATSMLFVGIISLRQRCSVPVSSGESATVIELMNTKKLQNVPKQQNGSLVIRPRDLRSLPAIRTLLTMLAKNSDLGVTLEKPRSNRESDMLCFRIAASSPIVQALTAYNNDVLVSQTTHIAFRQ